jgi:hypothetical protein
LLGPAGKLTRIGYDCRPTIALQDGAWVSEPLDLPGGGALVVAVGLPGGERRPGRRRRRIGGRQTQQSRGGARVGDGAEATPSSPVEVELSFSWLPGEGVEPVLLSKSRISATPGEWREARFPLPDELRGNGRFRVSVEGGLPAGVLVAQPLFESPGSAASSRRRGIILISLDTLRADHLRCYGYSRPTSPNLDRLAREGLLATTMISSAPWTLPSHMSLFTGLDPTEHGVTGLKKPPLDRSVPTLGERMAERGFWCEAFLGGANLAPSWGIERGFRRYDYGGGGARVVFGRAIDWLSERPRDRFFLFLHTMDIHTPYNRHTEHPVWSDGSRVSMDMVSKGARPLPELIAAYDDGIRSTDAALGALFSALHRLGYWDSTAIVIFADHGEEFLDHGGLMHGRSLHRELLHIPLIIRAPGGPQGRLDGQLHGLVDLHGTVLALGDALLQGKAPPDPLLLPRGEENPVLSETIRPKVVQLGFTGPRDRKIYSLDDSWGYSVQEDPAELRPTPLAEVPERVEAWRRRVVAPPEKTERLMMLDPEVEDQLRKMGYLQ